MSRHKGGNDKGKSSGRGSGNAKSKTFARGNAPIKKKVAPKTKPTSNTNSDLIRLNKYVANSGMCSRREADQHIAMGLVTVNGKVVVEMGYKVKLDDEVRYDGARINPEKKAYVLLNKPKGFATTTSEQKGRTVMDLVANATSSRIKPIGRLGRNSTGLLLFTNDEKIVERFTNSNKGVERLFHLELDKNLKMEDLKKIREGFKVEGKQVGVEEIDYVNNTKNEVGVKIKNTGNTILHTIFEHLKYELVRIDCVQIAHLTKKDIPRGNWKILSEQEVNTLKMM
ncbi:MAG: 23S rRNA pseudouridine2605 synthase [Olleya marilimosa]|jgi:23S rRNA pseudouridine2605 synthase|uniref:rRNA pseudouridine synthase n=1 Tax=Olleya marilimosa TaxID=272164 RepID=A0ABR8LXH7_9FLAO|nr:pseudouridine synthase [Olleya marilimosa]MBD3862722.1 rRNA pseudouridine synthase [Olleya marilimosa]MBD3890221.1 rRNA pseudouridine synthase [Olleya marilimosa]PIB32874.1 pseudouridylate synthase [Gaetbulibacter sp. 5U11]|tara:strand:- start:96174 stop:97022 length:849 start_codon:yes stop_codon:yes gene_type:complete